MGSCRTCRTVRIDIIFQVYRTNVIFCSGIYDKEYLAYVRKLLSLLPSFGLSAFVVIHQDVWSRYSGGSGAPAWTLEAVGFDLHALEESGAAWLLGVKGGGHVEAERGIWPCGYQKLAAATMAYVQRYSFLMRL
jgi:hypothetical protein